MRFTGIIGILTILLISFLMSNNRRKIKPRIIVWGLGLQILFAAIILGKNILSFAAMFLFLMMIIIYLFKDTINAGQTRQKQLMRTAMIILGSAGITFLLYFSAGSIVIGWIFWILALATLIKMLLKQPKYQVFLSSALLMSGFAFIIKNQLTGSDIFATLSLKVEKFLHLSILGAEYLFGNLALREYFFTDSSTWPGFGFQFAFSVLPVIIFFASFMAVLYHLGVMQKVISAMAHFMQWTMGTSGAETLSCSANIFVGQTEAPLLIKPFVPEMTKSELMTIMVGGFATIAGGVLAGYIALGIDAGHLIAASVMSAPAAIVVAKIIFPETEHPKTAGDVKIPENIVKTSNVLDAATSGVTDGLKLAANVGAMLIAFVSLIGLVDVMLSYADQLIDGKLLNGTYVQYSVLSNVSPIKGEFAGIFPGSLKTLFGTLLRPLAWLMGVSWQYAGEVGNLLGMKLTLTEFVAYGSLAELIANNALDEKAILISTYALCGFANFASIGIQIGGISAIAPGRRKDLSKVAVKAMFGGAFASWLTASIAGILL
ncbi:MAG: nucleoside transporter C-terminal domain-containing protein [Fidelibacterota bacterium]